MKKNMWITIKMLVISVFILSILVTTGCVSNNKPQVLSPPIIEITTKPVYSYGENIEINVSLRSSYDDVHLNSTSYRLKITGPQGEVFFIEVFKDSGEKINISAFSSVHIGFYVWNQTNMNFSQVIPGKYTIVVELLYDNYQGQRTITIIAPPSPNGTIHVSTEKQNYSIFEEEIIISLVFENNGSEQIQLYSTSFQLRITGSEGEVFTVKEMHDWTSLDPQNSSKPVNVSAYSEIEIGTYRWDLKNINLLRVPAGQYTIIGELIYDGYLGQTTILIDYPPD